jgi:hypothetical protein
MPCARSGKEHRNRHGLLIATGSNTLTIESFDLTHFTLDSVQEFRVTTSNYNADEGSSAGAKVAMVTKSGTNQFHGSAYEYCRSQRGLTGAGKHGAGNLRKPVTGRIARLMFKPSHREAILEGGMKVMFRLGYQGASVRDICAAAGVPQGSFTNHFRCKEAFAEKVLNRYFAHTKAVVKEALDDKSLTPGSD